MMNIQRTIAWESGESEQLTFLTAQAIVFPFVVLVIIEDLLSRSLEKRQLRACRALETNDYCRDLKKAMNYH